MKALVIGATGATGRELVDILLADPQYQRVITFVRRSSGVVDPKLEEHVVDMQRADQYADLIKGDVLFSAIGTTRKAAGSKRLQWIVDHDIPLSFARIARQNGVAAHVLVSSTNASNGSLIYYARMKGELEQHISELRFEQNIIFRPGLLDRPGSDRYAERMAVRFFNWLNTLSIAQRLRPMPTRILAERLSRAPQLFGHGESCVEMDEIFEI